MKKIITILVFNITFLSSHAQITTTTYRGAFAPAPEAMWTDNWTSFNAQNEVYPATTVDITATEITTNTTWTSNNVYHLMSQIYIKNGATLTIEPGTIIRGEKTSKACIIVTRGAKIIAEGTAAKPIIFTSDKAPGLRGVGDWGGIILLGTSAYNTNSGTNYIEGPTSSPDTLFGGGATPNLTDNSGIIKYVRIEFPGIALSDNNEINGLTFGAVGSGTTVDYVQVSHSGDDSFEWFGGTINCKHLVALGSTDDDYDTDYGYSGYVQFALGIKDPGAADTIAGGASEGFESDNNNTTGFVGTPKTGAIFTNVTLIGPAYRTKLPNGVSMLSQHQRAARIRRNSALKVFNSVFLDFKGGLFIENTQTETNAFTDKTMKWKNNILAGITSSTPVTSTTYGSTGATLTTWYTDGVNTTVASNANVLTSAYNTTDGQVYTGLDYRPTPTSIAATGADFTDADLKAATLANESFEQNNILSAVYPNPSNSAFTLAFQSEKTDSVNVNVYDVTGRSIENKTISYNAINNYEFGNTYNAGIYIAVVKQGQASKSFKIIKN